MAHLISFTTSRFDVRAERPNPTNPFAGQSVLNWLRGELANEGFQATEPDTEDWGWYMDVHGADGSYMVGASADADPAGDDVQWVVQVHKHRSMTDKLFGRNVLAHDDRLVAAIEKLVRSDSRIVDVAVERER
jgi:hypothetical protein